MTRTGRAGLLVAALLMLLGVVAPAGSPVAALPATSPVAVEPGSAGHAWQDVLHTVRDQPLRLSAARHVPPAASDTWWVLSEQAQGGCPPCGRAQAGAPSDRPVASVASPPRSSRAPPYRVS